MIQNPQKNLYCHQNLPGETD